MIKKYINRNVNSIYIDDLQNTSVKDNLIGISNRSKKRFRWYSENNIVEFEIEKTPIKNFEVKIAEIISNNKLNDEQKHDIQKLGTIIKQVDENLISIKDMLK